jgi:hypothetical protein
METDRDTPMRVATTVRWRRWRSEGRFIIAFLDQYQQNYSLDQPRLQTHFLRTNRIWT